MIRRALATALCLGLACLTAAAEDYHVILSGSGGEPEYREQFNDWSRRLSSALTTRADADRERIYWLAERENGEPAEASDITRESIGELFSTLAPLITEKDDLYIYIIGHGSAFSGESKFHIPGPDVTAKDFDTFLEGINSRRIILLNSTPASAGFINVLSAPNRVICTATKSVGEFNATRFMEHFIQALEDGSADRNHDDRISFEELCVQAAELTAGWYTSEALIATEHAILDDNADQRGTRLFTPDDVDVENAETRDGSLAAKVYVKDFSFPDSVPQELVDNYLASLDAIEMWKEKKSDMERGEYYSGLEKRLLDAARLNRDIRRHIPADDGTS